MLNKDTCEEDRDLFLKTESSTAASRSPLFPDLELATDTEDSSESTMMSDQSDDSEAEDARFLDSDDDEVRPFLLVHFIIGLLLSVEGGGQSHSRKGLLFSKVVERGFVFGDPLLHMNPKG